MRMLINCLIAAVCLCTAASLTACEKKAPDTAADALKSAGDAAEKAGDKIQEGTDKAAEKIKEATEKK